ncbi:hypothetical protein OG21DRAFT_1029690 [Imleria badia]|nr:hypothetical protein OG21DRAFT_1029690 [Imleria badia]
MTLLISTLKSFAGSTIERSAPAQLRKSFIRGSAQRAEQVLASSSRRRAFGSTKVKPGGEGTTSSSNRPLISVRPLI